MVATKRMLSRARLQDAKRRRTTGPSLAAAVRSLAESKYKNVSVTHNATTSSDTVLTDIATGNGSETRDGRKIMLTSASVQLYTSIDYLRVTIYVPKDGSATLGLGGSSATPIDNDEYWVLYDRIHANEGAYISVNLNMLRKLTVEYNDSTGTAIRNPVKMHLEGPTGTVLGHTKVWYKDI